MTGPVAGAATAADDRPPLDPPVTVTVAVPVQVKFGKGEVASVLPVIVIVCEPLARFSAERGLIVMIASRMPLRWLAVLGSCHEGRVREGDAVDLDRRGIDVGDRHESWASWPSDPKTKI